MFGCFRKAPPKYDYDIIIIGAGSGGLTAANFAAKLNARVCLVEQSKLGGDCTWTGCIPSKALLHVAKIAHHARTSGTSCGVTTSNVNVNMKEVHEYIHSRISDVYQHETPEVVRETGVEVLDNTSACFVDPHTIRLTTGTDHGQSDLTQTKTGDDSSNDGRNSTGGSGGSNYSTKETKNDPHTEQHSPTIGVRGRTLSAAFFVICTGAQPNVPNSITGIKKVPYMTYETIFDLKVLPKRLGIIGAGPIGCEMAQAFARLGSKVQIMASSILPKEQVEVRAVMAGVFEEEGIHLLKGRAASCQVIGNDHNEGNVDHDHDNDGDAILVKTKEGKTLVCDVLLVSAGRSPTVTGIGLENIGVQTTIHGIAVNGTLQTSPHAHIYAAGDCCGSEQFTHYAGWQAFQAVRNALLPGSGNGHSTLVPRCTFTDPEVAQVGLTLREAKHNPELTQNCVELKRHMCKNDRGVCDSDAKNGFISLVVNTKTHRLLGGTIVMSRAGEMINELAVGISNRLTIRQLASAIHAYPSYSFALYQMYSEYATNEFLNSTSGKTAIGCSVCCGVFSPSK